MGTHVLVPPVLVPPDGSPQSWAAFDHAISAHHGGRSRRSTSSIRWPGVYGDSEGGGYYDAQVVR